MVCWESSFVCGCGGGLSVMGTRRPVGCQCGTASRRCPLPHRPRRQWLRRRWRWLGMWVSWVGVCRRYVGKLFFFVAGCVSGGMWWEVLCVCDDEARPRPVQPQVANLYLLLADVHCHIVHLRDCVPCDRPTHHITSRIPPTFDQHLFMHNSCYRSPITCDGLDHYFLTRSTPIQSLRLGVCLVPPPWRPSPCVASEAARGRATLPPSTLRITIRETV